MGRGRLAILGPSLADLFRNISSAKLLQKGLAHLRFCVSPALIGK